MLNNVECAIRWHFTLCSNWDQVADTKKCNLAHLLSSLKDVSKMINNQLQNVSQLLFRLQQSFHPLASHGTLKQTKLDISSSYTAFVTRYVTSAEHRNLLLVMTEWLLTSGYNWLLFNSRLLEVSFFNAINSYHHKSWQKCNQFFSRKSNLCKIFSL